MPTTRHVVVANSRFRDKIATLVTRQWPLRVNATALLVADARLQPRATRNHQFGAPVHVSLHGTLRCRHLTCGDNFRSGSTPRTGVAGSPELHTRHRSCPYWDTTPTKLQTFAATTRVSGALSAENTVRCLTQRCAQNCDTNLWYPSEMEMRILRQVGTTTFLNNRREIFGNELDVTTNLATTTQ